MKINDQRRTPTVRVDTISQGNCFTCSDGSDPLAGQVFMVIHRDYISPPRRDYIATVNLGIGRLHFFSYAVLVTPVNAEVTIK